MRFVVGEPQSSKHGLSYLQEYVLASFRDQVQFCFKVSFTDIHYKILDNWIVQIVLKWNDCFYISQVPLLFQLRIGKVCIPSRLFVSLQNVQLMALVDWTSSGFGQPSAPADSLPGRLDSAHVFWFLPISLMHPPPLSVSLCACVPPSPGFWSISTSLSNHLISIIKIPGSSTTHRQTVSPKSVVVTLCVAQYYVQLVFFLVLIINYFLQLLHSPADNLHSQLASVTLLTKQPACTPTP